MNTKKLYATELFAHSVARRCAVAMALVASFGVVVPEGKASESPSGLRRAVLRVIEDATTILPMALVTPEMAERVGPGAHLLIDVPGETTLKFCTANFVYEDNGQRYLGAAGHCFLPSAAIATHGLDADYDASSVRTYVCVDNCVFGGAIGLAGGETQVELFSGKLVELGAVVYARQFDNAAQAHDLGNDFGIVAIPLGLRIRTKMPVFGGPTGVDEVQPGTLLCHYGNGVIAGETFLTMGRVSVGGGSTTETFSLIGVSAPGDSGSPVVKCEQNLLDFHGLRAVDSLPIYGLTMMRRP